MLNDCNPTTARQTIASARSLADRLDAGTLEEKRERLQQIIHQINLQTDAITIEIDPNRLAGTLGIAIVPQAIASTNAATIVVPIQLRRRGVEARLILADAKEPATQADPNLVCLIARAHQYLLLLTGGQSNTIAELAAATNRNPDEISRILPLAFLAPDIVRAIMEGRQPVELTAYRLARPGHLPIDWKEQRKKLGIT